MIDIDGEKGKEAIQPSCFGVTIKIKINIGCYKE